MGVITVGEGGRGGRGSNGYRIIGGRILYQPYYLKGGSKYPPSLCSRFITPPLYYEYTRGAWRIVRDREIWFNMCMVDHSGMEFRPQ